MNILFILGNGFDLNLGLKSSFANFNSFYCDIKTDCEDHKILKKLIKKDSANWADLELALGKYTSEIESPETYETLFLDIQNHLGDYLQDIQGELLIDDKSIKTIVQNLAKPYNYLPRADMIEVRNYYNEWVSFNKKMNIVTFNYTEVLEKQLQLKRNQKLLFENGKEIILQNIYHIHGTTNEGMIMGVDNIDQIINENFKNNDDLTDLIVKTKHNQVTRNSQDAQFINLIENSDLICIHGSSIGKTDSFWWSQILLHLLEQGRLIIFWYSDDYDNRIQGKVGGIKRMIYKKLFSYVDFDEKQKESVLKKIYVGVNTGIFKV